MSNRDSIETQLGATLLKSERLGVSAMALQVRREIERVREAQPALSQSLDLFAALVTIAQSKLNNPVSSPSDEALVEGTV